MNCAHVLGNLKICAALHTIYPINSDPEVTMKALVLWVDVDLIKRQLSVLKTAILEGEMTWIEHLHFYLGRALGAVNDSGI